MISYKGLGKTIKFTNESENTIAAGVPVVVGEIIGITGREVEAGAEGRLYLEGVYQIPKNPAEAMVECEVVFYDVSEEQAEKVDVGTIAEGDYVGLVVTEAAPAEVAASVVLTSTASPSDGDTVTVYQTVYTYKTALTSPAVPYEVLIGANETASLTNLKKAINAEATEGTHYGTGTVANAYVEATASTAHTITIAAKDAGEKGNKITVSTTHSHGSFAHPTLTGGIDGSYVNVRLTGNPTAASYELSQKLQFVTAPAAADSTGVAGQVAYDATHFYVCVATNTWVRASLATWT